MLLGDYWAPVSIIRVSAIGLDFYSHTIYPSPILETNLCPCVVIDSVVQEIILFEYFVKYVWKP